ncbi:hypothetical protein L210DRAFT_3504868 [Boletus edulis BED1]|uniref:Uncharacterized protein n=1 Tax=Boletus edulis BED1 TaxID=1328754 RepID=A0AAD4GDT7_BOLED|nr:hypothetical protein L210DRAFT_3504868 [Boletus edulis BED1]
MNMRHLLVPREAITTTTVESHTIRGWQRGHNGDDAKERERKLVEQHGMTSKDEFRMGSVGECAKVGEGFVGHRGDFKGAGRVTKCGYMGTFCRTPGSRARNAPEIQLERCCPPRGLGSSQVVELASLLFQIPRIDPMRPHRTRAWSLCEKMGGRAEEVKAEKDMWARNWRGRTWAQHRQSASDKAIGPSAIAAVKRTDPFQPYFGVRHGQVHRRWLCKDPVIVERRIAPRQYSYRVLDDEPPDLAVNGKAGCGMISGARAHSEWSEGFPHSIGAARHAPNGTVSGTLDCLPAENVPHRIDDPVPRPAQRLSKAGSTLVPNSLPGRSQRTSSRNPQTQRADRKVAWWRLRMYMATAVWRSPLGLPISQPSRKAKREQIMSHDVGRSQCTSRIRPTAPAAISGPIVDRVGERNQVSEVIRDAFTAFHTSDMLRKPEAGEVNTLPVPLFAVLNCSSEFWVLIAFGKSSVVHEGFIRKTLPP